MPFLKISQVFSHSPSIPHQLIMHPLWILSASGVEDGDDGPNDQLDVPKERSVLHVIHIQFQSDGQYLLVILLLIRKLIPIDIVPQARLRRQPTRHGGSDGILTTTSYIHLIHSSRARPHDRHGSVQDIHQLRQLVDLQPPHDLTPPKYTVLVRTQRSLIRAPCHTHRAKLPHLKLLIILPHPVGKVEQRSRVTQFRQDYRQYPYRRSTHNAKKGTDEIKNTLDYIIKHITLIFQ